jgi:sortase A
VLGRIAIPQAGISALVLEGVAGSTLRRGVGHIPGTTLPWLSGNIGLAGHRDSVFRGLKDIKKGDFINLETLEGTYRYVVDWAQVVDPDDIGVLAVSNQPELTLVTCYPFYYVGSAPERFVVRAHLLGGDGPAGAGAPHSAISAPAAPEKGYAAKDSP